MCVVEIHHRVDDHPIPGEGPGQTSDLIEVLLDLVRLARPDGSQVIEGGPFDRRPASEIRQEPDQHQRRHRQREHRQKELPPDGGVP